MQDLIRGIRKILGKEEANGGKAGGSAASGILTAEQQKENTIAPLLKRAFMFLEDGDWKGANEYCEKVLDRDPENARAYLGKLLAALHCHTFEELMETNTPFDKNEHYKKVLRFADPELKEKMMDCASSAQKNHILTTAIAAQEEDSVSQLEEAIKLYAQIPNWKDADQRAVACQARMDEKVKDHALEKGAAEQSKDTIPALQQAVKLFESVPGWKDADQRAELCRKRMEVLRQEEEAEEKRKKRNRKIRNTAVAVLVFVLVVVMILQVWIFPAYHYHRGETLREEGENIGAITEFQKAGSYEDARVALTDVINQATMPTIAAEFWHTVGLQSDGTVVATGYNGDGQCDVTGWTDIVAVAAGDYHTVGLKSDGTVVATEITDDDYNRGQSDVTGWTDIGPYTAQ